MAFERPLNVPVGWGSFDHFDHWQSSGRRIKPEMLKTEMLEEKQWSTDIMAPIRIVKEGSKELHETIYPTVERQDLPFPSRSPETLHELVNKRATTREKEYEKAKAKAKQTGLERS
jgi:hypothetical protein